VKDQVKWKAKRERKEEGEEGEEDDEERGEEEGEEEEEEEEGEEEETLLSSERSSFETIPRSFFRDTELQSHQPIKIESLSNLPAHPAQSSIFHKRSAIYIPTSPPPSLPHSTLPPPHSPPSISYPSTQKGQHGGKQSRDPQSHSVRDSPFGDLWRVQAPLQQEEEGYARNSDFHHHRHHHYQHNSNYSY